MKRLISTGFLIVYTLLSLNCESNEEGHDNSPLDIISLSSSKDSIVIGETVSLNCRVTEANGDILSYSWTTSSGFINGSGADVSWTAPEIEGLYTITCSVQDNQGGTATESIDIWVDDPLKTDKQMIGMWTGSIVGEEQTGPVNVLVLEQDVLISTPEFALISSYFEDDTALFIEPFQVLETIEFSWFSISGNSFPSYSEYAPSSMNISIHAIDHNANEDQLRIIYQKPGGNTERILLSRNPLYYKSPEEFWSYWADWNGSPPGGMETVSTTTLGNGNYSIQASRSLCNFSGAMNLINGENTLYNVALDYSNCQNVFTSSGYAWTKGFNWQQILILFVVTDDDRIIFESFTPLS